MGVDFVKFTGGEPLLYQGFCDVYQAAFGLFPRVAVETNGTVIPPNLFRVFKDFPPFHLSVSLDSHLPQVHDAFRGASGAWRKTTDFIRSLIGRSGIRPQVIMSVSEPDRQALTDMVGFLKGVGAGSLKVNLVSPVGKGVNSFFGRNDHFPQCVEFLEWAFARFSDAVITDAPPAFMPIHRLKSAGRCSILNLLSILPDGTVSFCGIAYSIPGLAMGTYPGASLRDIWENSPLLAELRESMLNDDRGICSRCVHWKSCMGKCMMENYRLGGSFSSPHAFCETAFRLGLFPETRLHE